MTPNIEKHIDATLIFELLRLAEGLKKKGDKLASSYGVTTQQWIIMLMLANDPNVAGQAAAGKPLLAKGIADAMQVSRANITNLLGILVDKGLVQQVEDPQDKRNKVLGLTPAGAQLIAQMEPLRHANNERLLAIFSPEQKEGLLQLLQTCFASLGR